MSYTKILVFMLLISACYNYPSGTSSSSPSIVDSIFKKDVSFNGDSLSINSSSKTKHTIYYSVMNKPFREHVFHKSISINTENLINEFSDIDSYQLAYEIISNNGIPVRVKVDNTIDTTFVIDYNISNNLSENNAEIVSGKCSKLISSAESIGDISTDVVKWLYKSEKHLDDAPLAKMVSLVKYLITKDDKSYYAEKDKEIPIIKSFAGISYNVKSNIKADYYYLFATDKSEEIDDFIAEVIANGYPQSSVNLNNSLSCYREADKGGLLTMFLIGINKDWTKTCIPVGVIIIDNVNPTIYAGGTSLPPVTSRDTPYSSTNRQSNGTEQNSTTYHFDSPLCDVVIQKTDIPSYIGHINVDTEDFRGGDAAFVVNWFGDVQKITIKRIAHDRWDYPAETKTINLSDKTSPYHFRYKLNLPLGKNYIPITVYDKMGNKAETTHLIEMVPVEDNKPDINIDNNINIWN